MKKPVSSRIKIKRGVTVLAGGSPMTLARSNKILRDMRAERDRKNLGNMAEPSRDKKSKSV
jgi:hypothetical protein